MGKSDYSESLNAIPFGVFGQAVTTLRKQHCSLQNDAVERRAIYNFIRKSTRKTNSKRSFFSGQKTQNKQI